MTRMFKIVRIGLNGNAQKNFYDSVKQFKKSYKQFLNEADILNDNHSRYVQQKLTPHSVIAYEMKPNDLNTVCWVQLDENTVKDL